MAFSNFLAQMFGGGQQPAAPRRMSPAWQMAMQPQSVAQTPPARMGGGGGQRYGSPPVAAEPPRRTMRNRIEDALVGLAGVDSTASPLTAFGQGGAGAALSRRQRIDQANDRAAAQAKLDRDMAQQEFENQLATKREGREATRDRFLNLRAGAETEKIAKDLARSGLTAEQYNALERRITGFRDSLLKQYEEVITRYSEIDDEESRAALDGIYANIEKRVQAERDRQMSDILKTQGIEGAATDSEGTREDPHKPASEAEVAELKPGEFYIEPKSGQLYERQ